MEPSRSRLKELALAASPPGFEDEVRQVFLREVEDIGEVSFDRLGSVVVECEGATPSPRVALDAHLDEVGFMVQSIDSAGRLAFVPVGGWWGHVLLAQRVDVLTSDGRIPGIIGSKPPHFLSPQERDQVLAIENMYIDIGASSEEEARALGVELGDAVAPHSEFIEFNEHKLTCKAFDDRVGVGLLVEVLRELRKTSHPNTVVGVAAVQEEVGVRGAATAAYRAQPDVAIILEGTPADDLPGYTDCQAKLGSGPQIRFYDPTAISNRRLVKWVRGVAQEIDLDLQLAVRRSGGTDASGYQRMGVGTPTVVIGVPARYIHTHVSMIDWRDYSAACRLVIELVRRLDQKTCDSLVAFDR